MTYRKPSNARFASDEGADDLLADILDSTESDALAEEEQLARTLAEQRAEAERREVQANAARIAERQAKLDAELARQAKLAERRTQKMAALQVSEAPAADADDDVVVPEEVEHEMRERIEAEVREQLRVAGMTPMPEPVATHAPAPSRLGIVALAAALTLAVAAGGVAFLVKGTYQTDPNTYAKAIYSPADRDLQSLEVGSTLVPKPEPSVVEEATPAAKRPDRNSPRVRRPTPKEVKPAKISGEPDQNDANKSFNKLQEALSASDPFSIDAQ